MDGLEFWIGRWTATWEGGHGTNSLTRDLDGHVITERFEALEPERFSGLSVSVQGPDGIWRQTWVDSTGSYWHFEGGPQNDGTFIFATPERVDTDRLYKRMVFSDIAEEAFSWRWEFSEDRVTWDPRWQISYRRDP
ncbi:MAG: hypothetical protein ABI828_05740 [Actinomycetota bacterium]